jgi:cell cycle sensor histidine kinase DivJ
VPDNLVGDLCRLRQVIVNLVGNALKFTSHGEVVLSIDEQHRDEGEVVLHFAVNDTGIGIPADKLASLGQPFMQVQNEYTRRYEGTGLGLSLVKGLVALHGGSFSISSVAGDGTVITILIPLDGSGAEGADHQAGYQNKTVDFPPRLKNAMEPAEQRTTYDGMKEDVDDHAEAKIA